MSSQRTAELLVYISQQYTIYVSFTFLILGLFGNALTIVCFTNLKVFESNACVFYLTGEAFINLVASTFYFTQRLITMLYGSDLSQYSLFWCRLRPMIGQTCLLSVLYNICLIAFDQYLSTNHRLQFRQLSTVRSARRGFFLVVGCSLVHTVVCGSFYDIRPVTACAAYSPSVVRYYSYFFYPLLSSLLPILISSSFGILAYRNVRRIIRRQLPIARRRLDRQMTRLVLVRVVFLIVLIGPVAIYRVYVINVVIDPNDLVRGAIERLLLTIITSIVTFNHTLNFYVFFASSSRYRRQVKHVLFKKCWQPCKRRLFTQRIQIDPFIARPISSIEFE